MEQQDINKIAEDGRRIYDGMKNNYEPKDIGRFLAIDTKSEDIYLGASSVEALDKARAAHPGNIFYVVKIGFDTAETLAQSLLLNTR